MQKLMMDALKEIYEFQQNPQRAIKTYYEMNNLDDGLFPIILSKEAINNAISELDEKTKSSIDELSNRLDKLNNEFLKGISNPVNALDISYLYKPLERIGIFVPYKLPSTAYTFLSAAKASGVKNISVYLAFSKNEQKFDNASIYVAQKYGAEIICGPAKYGFPALAFGVNGVFDKSDKIFGPCGQFLNIIKQLSALIAGCDSDMSAGPSDLTIITDNIENIGQIELDLLSQLDHGPDSKAFLILINQKYKTNNDKINQCLIDGKIKILNFDNWYDGIMEINKLAPETVVIYSKSDENIKIAKDSIVSAGVCYVNCINSLGDYGAIGRGCADPTGKLSKSQSGISPLMFMKIVPIVEAKNIDVSIKRSGAYIAQYENLENHQRAIEGE